MTTATATKTTPTPTTPATPTTRSDVSKVEVGSYFSRHSFGKVTEKSVAKLPNGESITVVKVEDAAGAMAWLVDGPIIEKEFSFADQFDATEKVSRTLVIEMLTQNPHTAMTVSFRKKVDPKTVAKSLEEGKGDVTTRTWNKRVKEALAGETSELIGYHTGNFDEHQRLRFIKLNSTTSKGPNFRLVDPRTVDYLVVNRTKYVVK